MLFAPAAFLVLRGNRAFNEARVRFGCALRFAMIGSAVVISSLPATGSDGAPRETSPDGGDAMAGGATAPISVPAAPVTQPVG